MANVQIPMELFYKICDLVLWENNSIENYNAVKTGLNDKVDALLRHWNYTEYKTAETEEERQRARKKYLDSIGMRDSFRWSNEYDENMRKGSFP